MNLIESYRSFLDKGKTERECVKEIIKLAEKEGYRNIESTDKLHAGDKVYYVQYGKSIALFTLLRRHKEVSVGNASSRNTRNNSKEGWNID